jgi:hypothetical protein
MSKSNSFNKVQNQLMAHTNNTKPTVADSAYIYQLIQLFAGNVTCRLCAHLAKMNRKGKEMECLNVRSANLRNSLEA